MPAADLVHVLTSLVVPPRCGICARSCGWREPACERCVAALRAASPTRRALPGFEGIVCAAPYQGAARELVAALKFGPRPRLARLAAATIARGLDVPPEGAVVPVPAAPRRLRSRGFDPADAIGASLARELGLRLDRCLWRADGRRQVGRSRGERLASPPRVTCEPPAPSRAILVDDVLTTGATLAACARALRAAGCGEVHALVFAIATRCGPLAPTPWLRPDRGVALPGRLQSKRRE